MNHGGTDDLLPEYDFSEAQQGKYTAPLPANESDGFGIVREVWRRANWPGVEEGLSYGTPALKVRGKLLVRLREPDVIVLMCKLDEKEFLKQIAPEVYFEVPHYHGYPAILARLSTIDPADLAERIERTWRKFATKKMLAEFDVAN